MSVRGALIIAAAAATLLFADSSIHPRGSAADYPAHDSAGGVTIGATIVPPNQVKKLFATDLNGGGYIVVEVAIYPDAGHELNVSPGDFMLQVGPNSETVRAATPQAIASILQKKTTPPPPKPGDVTVVPTATIGYESGGYDPVTGQRTRGVYTGAGVGVGIGGGGAPPPPDPAATGQNRAVMQLELEDKGLPDGKTSGPIAGYLYFPKPSSKTKNASPALTYYGPSQIKLRLAASAKP